ncbi:uncharacterized protein LOC110182001 [Drosophila serrata]|uniref:uncharacterized protein LOC110182000 n=1 Tax=Drosophila serrata TaxID=7274 RepID=UPI000A1D3045|nr:uncharacterized protein LOC110182000 [Drosophila serrata]XP_020805594.1 uncharacterized protein LOC110182001 [Drosophila serrata]
MRPAISLAQICDPTPKKGLFAQWQSLIKKNRENGTVIEAAITTFKKALGQADRGLPPGAALHWTNIYNVAPETPRQKLITRTISTSQLSSLPQNRHCSFDFLHGTMWSSFDQLLSDNHVQL